MKFFLKILMIMALIQGLHAEEEVETEKTKVVNNKYDTFMSSLSIGLSSFSNEGDYVDIDDGLYLGVDLMTNTKTNDFSFGIGFDLMTFQVNRDYNNNSSDYSMGIQLKVGYNLKELTTLPIKLKAEYGYGVTRFIDENYGGVQYGYAIEGQLYKSFGIGAKYKYVDVGAEYLEDYDSTTGYIYFSF